MSIRGNTMQNLGKKIAILIVSIIIFFIPLKIIAYDNYFTDDFESYAIDDLNGQGNWSGSTNYDVVNSISHSGDNSAYIDNYSSVYVITATTTPQVTGQVTMYFYLGADTDTTAEGNRPTISLIGCKTATPSSCVSLTDNDVYWDGDSYNFAIRNEAEVKTDIVTDLSLGEWYQEIIEFDVATWQYRARLAGYEFSDWFGMDRTDLEAEISQIYKIQITGFRQEFYFDDFGSAILPDTDFTISSPVSGSTVNESFDIVGYYQNATIGWKIMMIFEDWDASSTCPAYGDEDFAEQRNLYFNYQSFPYFSSSLTTATGTATINITNLSSGNYTCVRCYYIHETTGYISDEICENYTLNVSASIPFEELPNFNYPFTTWDDYYSSATDKWATSTGLFSTLANAITPLINWVGNLAVSFQTLLSTTTAASYGNQFGGAVPTMRGYLVIINNFFNGLPVSNLLIFFIICAIFVLIYKLIHSFISLIKP